ncbi:MAG: protein-tyrosine-phosphatase [Bacteroidetes bacterium]|jgi:protein-tyrosine phosphatase|nr:protein-tyrosine-phosphatase [Bacteroidota bacterium]MDF2450801.1 protein-tyrosine-phosphatase [Bacteroidota bacterium]
MQKILMVCLGNICRSPLAEGIMLKLIKENNINMRVDSAGTSSFHIDEAPDHRTVLNAAKHNIDLKPLRARQFKASDFEKFDKIYVMDKSNLANVLALASSESHKEKVDLLLNASHPDQYLEVPDPYHRGEQGFEDVFHLVYKACQHITFA